MWHACRQFSIECSKSISHCNNPASHLSRLRMRFETSGGRNTVYVSFRQCLLTKVQAVTDRHLRVPNYDEQSEFDPFLEGESHSVVCGAFDDLACQRATTSFYPSACYRFTAGKI